MSEEAGINGLSLDAFNNMRAGAGEVDYGTLSGLTDEMTAAERANLLKYADNFERSAGPGLDQAPMTTAEELKAQAKFYATSESVRTLRYASAIHLSTLALTGYPPYEKGEELRTSAGEFHDASAILGSADSDPGWQGPATKSYSGRNTEQQARTERMAALDKDLADLLQEQETQVANLRYKLAGMTAVLLAAFPEVAVLHAQLYFGCVPPQETWPAPTASALYLQIRLATFVLGTDATLMSVQGFNSRQTGAAMQTVADGYNQIAAEAQAALPLHS